MEMWCPDKSLTSGMVADIISRNIRRRGRHIEWIPEPEEADREIEDVLVIQVEYV